MIDAFEGTYAFLSNYYDPCPIRYRGRTYRNSESAYQAQKCLYGYLEEMFEDLSPDDAKALGREVAVIPDWDARKADVMREIVHEKFKQHGELAARLIETGEEDLVEGNDWHDNFFGVCRCPRCKRIMGQNWLGLILMDERERLRSKYGRKR